MVPPPWVSRQLMEKRKEDALYPVCLAVGVLPLPLGGNVYCLRVMLSVSNNSNASTVFRYPSPSYPGTLWEQKRFVVRAGGSAYQGSATRCWFQSQEGHTQVHPPPSRVHRCAGVDLLPRGLVLLLLPYCCAGESPLLHPSPCFVEIWLFRLICP